MNILPKNVWVILAIIILSAVTDGIGQILVGIAAIIYGIATIINAEKSRK